MDSHGLNRRLDGEPVYHRPSNNRAYFVCCKHGHVGGPGAGGGTWRSAALLAAARKHNSIKTKDCLPKLQLRNLNASDFPGGDSMKLPRRQFLHLAAAAIGSLAAPAIASAQAYPTRPIQVIVPFAGGSASDVVMRILLDRMGKSIGQPFIVDNRPGAGGNIGTNAGTKAAPDGYTLVMGSTGPMAANRTLYRELGYDPEKDLEPISLFSHFPILVVVSSKLPVKSLAEFVTYAKARPKQLNYGSVGIGSSQHLAGVYFEQVTGLELTHVPYRNIAQYVPDLIAGAVPVGFQWLPNV